MPIVASILVIAASLFAAIEALDFASRARFFPLGAAIAGLLFAGGSLAFDVLEWRHRRIADSHGKEENSPSDPTTGQERDIERAEHSVLHLNDDSHQGPESSGESGNEAKELEDIAQQEPNANVPPVHLVLVHFTHIALYLVLFRVLGFTLATGIYVVGFLIVMTAGDGWRFRLLAVLGLGGLAVLITLGLRMISGSPI